MTTFCEQLRFWRKNKNFSQLDLALEANVSSKHISFIETGRSKPSKLMVLSLCEALGVPLRNRNELLSLAGFSEQYVRTPLGVGEMERLSKTLEIILNKQDPYPAIVLDWDWNIILNNKGFTRVCDAIAQEYSGFSNSNNIAELVFAPNGFKSFLGNWEEVARTTIQRLQYEQQESPGRHEKLLEKMFGYPDVSELTFPVDLQQPSEPFIYVDFVLGGKTLKFLTTLTSFGTPIDITASEILIEQYYPADEDTRLFLETE